MKYLFWVSVDDILKDFIIGNKMLQYVSKIFPFVAVCSGEESHKWISRYYGGSFHTGLPNDLQIKGYTIIRLIQGSSDTFDYIVRIDMDAIIMNPIWLIKRIEDNVNRHHRIIAGNPAIFNHESHIRGGCNVTTGRALENFQLHPYGNPMAFDEIYTRQLVANGVIKQELEIFEINNYYTGKCPVWHPDKSPYINDPVEYLAARFEIFESQMERLK